MEYITLCHRTFENPFLLPFLIILPLSPPHPNYNPKRHNIDNILKHHFIINIFSLKQVTLKPLLHKLFPTFF